MSLLQHALCNSPVHLSSLKPSPNAEQRSTLLRRQRFHIPNHIRILLNAPITAEKPHATNTSDAFTDPLILILVRLIHKRMRLDVAIKVIAHEVVIAVIDDGIAERGETSSVAEHAGFNGVEDLFEVFVELEGAVVVGVAEVFDVFGEVAEEEDVVFADFAGDFDLWLSKLKFLRSSAG